MKRLTMDFGCSTVSERVQIALELIGCAKNDEVDENWYRRKHPERYAHTTERLIRVRQMREALREIAKARPNLSSWRILDVASEQGAIRDVLGFDPWRKASA